MKNVELSIPGMQSAHCQARVNGAIKDIDGVIIEKLEAGKLSVSFERDEVKEEMIEAIVKAGYKVENNNTISSSCSSTSCC
ncbi:heavy-metal-associated domain-containing protein [Lunatibacter salilacus]|uniref:heavy-metal-associated domain-containing protein n=1 Tax=Lunatibacter salilacus TaxID=2483804 RepID=UPI00131B89F3|nr:heavy-metal-associated domain-containing protein [Lunatibacter salilacus]